MERDEVIIIGSGLAAWVAASSLCREKDVRLITKGSMYSANSYMAQGGIAGVVANDDSIDQHVHDTLSAGVFLNDVSVVERTVQRGSALLKGLVARGFPFDRDEKGQLLFGLEGAHSRRRILHAGGDGTGWGLTTYFVNAVHPFITVHENETFIDLITENGECIGVKTKIDDTIHEYYGTAVILATGGYGGLFKYNSNDHTVLGEGISIAYDHHCYLADMEFIQFHPTLLFHEGTSYGLVSEALRGEGAVLENEHGERFMEHVHTNKDLAPRDIVAREIQRRLLDGEKVFLNVEAIPNLEARFPTVFSKCIAAGLEVPIKRIPVAPGAHFTMGGIKVNEYGETNIKRLYAVGEVSCTGLHGANRLASNSLLEAYVFAVVASEHIINKVTAMESRQHYYEVAKDFIDLPTTQELREKMTHYLGITRNEEGLMLLLQWLEPYQQIEKLETLPIEQILMLHRLQTSYVATKAALYRPYSIGAHARIDAQEEQKETIRRQCFLKNCKTKLTI